jgi:DNA repair protein RadC
MKHKVSLVKVLTVMEEGPREKLDSPDMAASLWRNHVEKLPTFDPNKEHVVAVLLDTKYKVIGWNLVSVGVLNESLAHPREVFRPAIVGGAYAVILMHNHPSGDPSPSAGDHSLTRRMADAGDLLNIKVLDHVIVGNGTRFSFKEAGIL